jgi:hypothetical protein
MIKIEGFAVIQLLYGSNEWSFSSKIFESVEKAQSFIDFVTSHEAKGYWAPRKYQIVKVSNHG